MPGTVLSGEKEASSPGIPELACYHQLGLDVLPLSTDLNLTERQHQARSL